MLQTFLSDVTYTLLDQYNDTSLENLTNSPDFQEYRDKFYDQHEVECKRNKMWRFWSKFLSMVENLLPILNATNTGDWILYIESISRYLPWTFAHNRENYVCYRTL